MKTYEPINILKPVAPDVWIVNGPVVRFKLGWFSFPFTTRMTVVRLSGERLFIHSPTPLASELKVAVKSLGDVRWLVSPTRLHYRWLPEWKRDFPDADVYLAPRVRRQPKGRILKTITAALSEKKGPVEEVQNFKARLLDAPDGYPWDAEIRTLPVAGSLLTEVVFFHEASRTLIVADFMENFEPRMIDTPFVRLVTRLGGVQNPHGGMPRDMRMTFDARLLAAAVSTMLSWEPERIILSHGRWYETNGKAELQRAFRTFHSVAVAETPQIESIVVSRLFPVRKVIAAEANSLFCNAINKRGRAAT